MKLELGGKEFDLKPITVNQLAQLEDMGLDIMTLGEKGKFKIKHIRQLLWVIISKEDKSITEEWIGDNIDMQRLVGISKELTSFLSVKQ